MTTTATMKRFADLVDLADSGETGGRVEGDGIWRQAPVANAPGKVVFTRRGTRWCYPVEDLRNDPRLREAIKRTAAMRAAAAEPQFVLRDRSRAGEVIFRGSRAAALAACTEACKSDPSDTGNLYVEAAPGV